MDNRKIEKKISKETRGIPHIIPAYKIKKKASGNGYLEDYVNEILPVIEDDIQKVIDSVEKKDYSMTEIQTTFDIPGMSNKRAQMYVYFHLLRALEKAKYFANIKILGDKPSNQKVFIYVKWFSKDDIEMEKYMNKFIQSKTIGAVNIEEKKPISRRRRK